MTQVHRFSLIGVLGLLLLLGCGPSDDLEQDVLEQRADGNDSVIAAPLHRAVDRAENVEAVINDQAEQLRRRLEDAEGR